jgi:glyoxylase-like metal-dependent hydrolase (beta-lactamase superfamily II)
MNRISDHVYWMNPEQRGDRPLMGAVAGKNGTLVVEGGNSKAHARLFWSELRAANLPKPAFVAITHWHWDHVFGAGVFGVPILSSNGTQRIVQQMARMDWSDAALDQRVEEGVEIAFCRDNIKIELPDRTGLTITPPNIAFEGAVSIDLGGVTAQLVPVGGDHASDSTVVYVPEERILFLGDCHYPDLYHGPDNYTVNQLFPLIDKLLSFPVDFYLCGHQDEPVPSDEMAEYLGMHKTAGRAVEALGPDRDAILGALCAQIARWGQEDVSAIVDAFLNGMVLARK